MSTVLVTGANRGLGYEFVKQYSKSNFNVLACCRSAENAYELQELSKGVKNIKIPPKKKNLYEYKVCNMIGAAFMTEKKNLLRLGCLTQTSFFIGKMLN